MAHRFGAWASMGPISLSSRSIRTATHPRSRSPVACW
jgi:hypothetical protein